MGVTPYSMPKLCATVTCFVEPASVDQIVLLPSSAVEASQSFLRVHSLGSLVQSAAELTEALASKAITVKLICRSHLISSANLFNDAFIVKSLKISE